MRCARCGGLCVLDWDFDRRCINCNRPASLAPPRLDFPDMAALMAPLADDESEPARRRARRHSVGPDEAANIRRRMTNLPWGTRNAVAGQIAAEFGLSVVYVQQIARGHHRA